MIVLLLCNTTSPLDHSTVGAGAPAASHGSSTSVPLLAFNSFCQMVMFGETKRRKKTEKNSKLTISTTISPFVMVEKEAHGKSKMLEKIRAMCIIVHSVECLNERRLVENPFATYSYLSEMSTNVPVVYHEF